MVCTCEGRLDRVAWGLHGLELEEVLFGQSMQGVCGSLQGLLDDTKYNREINMRRQMRKIKRRIRIKRRIKDKEERKRGQSKTETSMSTRSQRKRGKYEKSIDMDMG